MLTSPRAMRAVGLTIAVAIVLGAFASSAHALTFTCEAIARKDLLDPAGATFANKFGKNRHGGPAINASGDVVFFATPRGGPRRLYLYPGTGAASIIAEQGGSAPGGGSFTQFRQPSINDAQDIAFFGDLATGEGVFIRLAAGPTIVKAAATGDPSPSGGTFATFPGVSRINPTSQVAFYAIVDGGPSGIFRYDAGTMTVTTVALVGDLTLDGRQICEFVAPSVGLGSSRATFYVSTKLSCADALEDDLIGIYRETGLGSGRVALEGDPTPVGGTTYSHFDGQPDSNATDQVLFRARVTGTSSSTGLFLFDPAGPTTAVLVRTGDSAAGGGAFKTITQGSLTDGGRVGFRASLRNSPAHEGIFLYDGADEAVVRRSDPVPTNLFTPGSTYRKIYEEIGVDRGGSRVTYSATAKLSGSGTKLGLFRCNGV